MPCACVIIFDMQCCDLASYFEPVADTAQHFVDKKTTTTKKDAALRGETRSAVAAEATGPNRPGRSMYIILYNQRDGGDE